MGDEPGLRNDAIGVFKLLAAYADLQRRPVLDLSKYQSHIWFANVKTDHRSYNRFLDDGREVGSETWLELSKQPEPLLKPPPDSLKPWVVGEELLDDQELPSLRERVPADSQRWGKLADDEIGIVDWLHIDDHPQVSTAWDSYLEKEWLPWSEKHAVWRSYHRDYSTLFAMRQSIKREGEQLELVVGFGLLTRVLQSTPRIRRHVLTLRAKIDFDIDHGTISVRVPLDGTRPSLETDMLPVDQRPPDEVIDRLDSSDLPSIEENPCDRAAIDRALKAFANAYPDAEYVQNLSPVLEENRPFVVGFSPALILRKRSIRGKLAAFKKVIKQLESDGAVPPSIRILCGSGDSASRAGDGQQSPANRGIPDRIYFPNPTNDEQQRIVHRIDCSSGLLVQGPPGTGKSHTIGNLVCHLLATGRRVLVTAETSRALRVLAEQKIPQSIRPLCVSLLGNDRESRAELEASVRGIAERSSKSSASDEDKHIDRLAAKLDQTLQRQASLDQQLRSLREAEFEVHEVGGGDYRGTAQAIAEQVALQTERFRWFRDDVKPEGGPPLDEEEFGELVHLLNKFDPARLQELELAIPDPTKMLPPTQVALERFEDERRLESKLNELNQEGDSSRFSKIGSAPIEKVDAVAESISRLRTIEETAKNRRLPWIDQAFSDVLDGDESQWRTLREITASQLNEIGQSARLADTRQVKIPQEVDRMTVLADATDLLQMIGEDESINVIQRSVNPRYWKFRYLFKQVTIDGRFCDSATTLSNLIDYLEVSKRLDNIWRQWEEISNSKPSTFALQVSRLEENVEALDQVLGVHVALQECRDAIRSISGLPEPAWYDQGDRDSLNRACQLRHTEEELQQVSSSLRSTETTIAGYMSAHQSHPVVEVVLNAVRARAEDTFVSARLQLAELYEAQGDAKRRRDLLDRLREGAPETADDLERSPGDADWTTRSSEFGEAWRWGQVRAWLALARDKRSINELNASHLRCQEEASKILEELASRKAWKATLDRIEEPHRRHLEGWLDQVKKLGKGTGKYASRYRAEAQRHLEKCREVIPAWIMPLFELFETVAPVPGMFDVVIVDEASQCGLDALLLMYLGKQIVIVGDDEQISPAAVGIDVSEFNALVDRFLPDFEHKDAFDPKTSLFGMGSRWFPDRIVLREHFRCMPEIIRFSNDLCYKSTPLIPLRQYPPKRLKPVGAHFVDGGVQRGSASRAINIPEADALVDYLVSCCNDPLYSGKKFGVISLLGDQQAKLIESKILERLSPEEFEDRKIVCGGAYSFQGDERHVMLLSMVNASKNESGVPVRSPARTADIYKQRYNVAASRAQDQIMLFHSLSMDDLPRRDDLRRLLVDHCVGGGATRQTVGGVDVEEVRAQATARSRDPEPPSPFDSWFEVDVFLKIHDAGYRVLPQFEVAGYSIDLVIEGGSRRLAVECDGDEYHGPDQIDKDLYRERQLVRAGWRFWRVRGSEFRADPDRALEDLWSTLDKHRIWKENKQRRQHERHQAGPTPGDGASSGDDWKSEETDSGNTPESEGSGDFFLKQEGHALPFNGSVPSDEEPGESHLEEPNEPDDSSDQYTKGVIQTHSEPKSVRMWKDAVSYSDYTAWEPGPLQDPLSVAARELEQWITNVVDAEGPVSNRRLVSVCSRAAGRKATKPVKRRFNQAVQRMVSRGSIEREYQFIKPDVQVQVLKLRSQQWDSIRSLGPRDLYEIPPTELGALMRGIMDQFKIGAPTNPTPVFRRVLDFYGLKVLREKAQRLLLTALERHTPGVSGPGPNRTPDGADAGLSPRPGQNNGPSDDPLESVIDWLSREAGPRSGNQIMEATNLDSELWPSVRDGLKQDDRISVMGKKKGTKYRFEKVN